MVSFQRKYDAACVILLSDNQVSCDTTDYDSFPIIVSYPPVSTPYLVKYFPYFCCFCNREAPLSWRTFSK